jgi:hypothetical protein
MFKKIALMIAVLGLVLFSGQSVIAAGRPVKVKPKVEVVFCLDTTGSMDGLIEGAKQKIWGIANQIVKGKPTPDLRIGLVAYRDEGDEYVTKVYSLDSDLDTVFENLMSFEALGGGDGPEHVNKALYDSVHKIQWSKDKSTLKIIFLVGDAPPHMDYDDGYDYRKICKEAVKKDIIINTIQCGDYDEAQKYWRDIAKRGEGKYAKVEQSGGMEAIETPMDDELAALSLKLEGTVVAYGAEEVRAKSEGRKASIKEMPLSVAAERAAYKSAGTSMGAYDLIDAVKSGKIKLSDIKDKELPEEMRKMSLAQRKKYLAKKEKERKEIKAKIEKINKKRSAYIAKKLKEDPKTDAFDSVVQGIIKEQAAKNGIR